MSEPIQKGEIDLSSLDQALNDGEAASQVSSETLLKNSDTLAQPPADARSSVGTPTPITEHVQKASSPATLSPSSPRAMSPNTAPVHPTTMAQPTTNVHPAVTELKSMFPDLDTETIATVLSSRGGNQESAVNALLQMSDPSFKPTTSETGTDSDALLAQTIAMEEEQRHHELMARQQHSQNTGRGGGGAGSFFSGLLNSDSRGQPASSAPSYDPNALTYQPRVRKAPPANPGVAGNRMSYAAPSHPPAAASPSHAEGESAMPGMPGAKDAKQWQEEINRMAETGLARAATTFSSLRQKASAAFNNPQDGGAGAGQSNSRPSGGNGGGAGFAQAFQNFRTGSGRGSSSTDEKPAASNASIRQGLTSPRSPNASEYDQDPSPVSENELAKIIARGGGSGGASTNKSSSGKARALADRYGLGIKNGGRASPSTTQAASGAASATGSQYSGWDEAGRTPISIKDNTSSASTPRAATPAGDANKTHVDSVALMDSASGRGVTSPRLDRSPTKESTPSSTAAAQTATPSSATGVGSTAPAKHDAEDVNDDSDDLEYVSNPFEDED